MTNRSHALSSLALVGLLVGTTALRLTPSRSISFRGSLSPHARNGPPMMLELPKLPNPFGDGGPSFPELPNPFAEEFVAKPGDVSFVDTDGEQVTLRKVGGKVDLYVGGKLKLEGTVMVRSGNALQFTGKETKGTPLSMLGFNLEDTITVGATPRDPADVDKAMELV